jgi:hypothetical protein
MITTIKKALYAKRINHLLETNQITIIHYLPGRIRLGSPMWKNDSSTLNYLIEELKTEKRIHSITYTKATGSILVTYDTTPVSDTNQFQIWFRKLERVFNESIHKRKGRNGS